MGILNKVAGECCHLKTCAILKLKMIFNKLKMFCVCVLKIQKNSQDSSQFLLLITAVCYQMSEPDGLVLNVWALLMSLLNSIDLVFRPVIGFVMNFVVQSVNKCCQVLIC